MNEGRDRLFKVGWKVYSMITNRFLTFFEIIIIRIIITFIILKGCIAWKARAVHQRHWSSLSAELIRAFHDISSHNHHLHHQQLHHKKNISWPQCLQWELSKKWKKLRVSGWGLNTQDWNQEKCVSINRTQSQNLVTISITTLQALQVPISIKYQTLALNPF